MIEVKNEINEFNKLRGIWNQSINNLGESKPSKNGHTSIFFYPYNFKILRNKKLLLNKLLEKGWIKNDDSEDFHKISKLTDYIQDSIFDKNMIFSKRVEESFEIWVDGLQKNTVMIEKIELVLFENDIAIFSLFVNSEDSIHNISSIVNRELRNPSCLYFDLENKRILSFDDSLKNVSQLKEDYQKNLGSFVDFNNYLYVLVDKKTIELKHLKSGKSKYAKYITSIHTDISKDLEIELLHTYSQLQQETDVTVNLLQICSNQLSTSNDLIVNSRKFEHDIDFVRSNIKKNGIRLWSLWSGIANLNSLSFLSINDGGRSIVHQSKNEIYLIFLINFYIKLRLQHLDKEIIDESFMQQNKSRENLENLLNLKAKYFSEEIADSFQPLIIDKKIKSALGIDELVKNIEENILKTKELTKENNSAVLAIIAAIYVSANEIIPFFTDSVTNKIVFIIVTTLIAFLLWKKRSIIGQAMEKTLKFFKIL